jgi:hypothetical protein
MASTNWGDIAKTASAGFEPLPIGDYDVVVEAATYKLASTGSDMFCPTFVGRKLWTNLVLKKDSPNAVAAFFRKMAALGLDAAFFATVPVDNDDLAHAMICQALAGAEAIVGVKHKVWQDKTQNEVDAIKAKASSGPTPAAGIPSLPPVAAIPAATPVPTIATQQVLAPTAPF